MQYESNLAHLAQLVERSGEEPFSDRAQEVLLEPTDPRIVSIRPDGLVFVSHPHYRDRLDRAFGVGGWSLVPLATPRIHNDVVLYYGFLKANGRFVGDAYGAHPYHPNNRNMDFSDAVESAKSNCLMRCCKSLPLFRELWDTEWRDAWLKEYAEKGVVAGQSGRHVWKKKGEALRGFSMRPDRAELGEYHRPSRIEDENRKHLESIAREEEPVRQAAREYVLEPEEWEPGSEG